MPITRLLGLTTQMLLANLLTIVLADHPYIFKVSTLVSTGTSTQAIFHSCARQIRQKDASFPLTKGGFVSKLSTWN